ncbi:MAG TPA: tyrosine-type recombinase/integrase [Acidimicrobiales bacterium]|nr:tyrosine-type recombinase/integrase [Acidimicrobiales bacterium]
MARHFRKRGARWYFWIALEPGADGLRRQRSVGGFRTRRKAEIAYSEMRNEIHQGLYVEPSRATLGSFLLSEWLPAIRSTVRPTTWEHYRRAVEGYAVPNLGARRLVDLTPAQLNALYAQLLREGRRNVSISTVNRGLSPKTVRHVHTMLHKALNDAVRWGHLARNPADRADPPRPASPEMHVWSREQLRAFLKFVEPHRLYGAWLLFGTTGMRRGEVLGLRWREVDLKNKRLSIVRALVDVNRETVVSEPKTAKGRRTVALDAVTAAELERHRICQLEERLRIGDAWQDTGLVFTHEDGSFLSPRLVSSWFAHLSRDAGLPRIRLHDVRHSYATAALIAGNPTKVVSERLGHASIAITLGTYSHVLPNMQEDAAEEVARIIFGSVGIGDRR